MPTEPGRSKRSGSNFPVMTELLKNEFRFLSKPLNWTSRGLLLLGVLAIMASYWFPLWQIHLIAPQYRDGLSLDIHSWRIVAGNNGNDLVEINELNHYIGMHPLKEADFFEMKWMPFILGFFVMLTLRAAVFGMMRNVIDLFILFSYFGTFSMGSFVYRLYTFGHSMDPHAAIHIKPFTPVIFGTQKIANFTQSSLPQIGTYLLAFYVVSIVLAIWYSRKEAV